MTRRIIYRRPVLHKSHITTQYYLYHPLFFYLILPVHYIQDPFHPIQLPSALHFNVHILRSQPHGRPLSLSQITGRTRLMSSS